ncbi:hypothetical protein [Arthrobacter sp. H14]|uniref:hypothetical protein n=1 Tax=Arthrobacter sp. H14 TaxID=1312959 RepID=UPI001C1DF6CF|nr:hypothetical protein [Arthrobacter sp. H14]
MTNQSSSNKPSLFNRLRAMPGFTVAVVAFCLTVVMGAGGTYAYALWNQTAKTAINVTTGDTNLAIDCVVNGDEATFTWGPDGARSYTYTVTGGNNGRSGTGNSTVVTAEPGLLGGLLGLSSITYDVTVEAEYGGSWASIKSRSVTFNSSLLGGISGTCSNPT